MPLEPGTRLGSYSLEGLIGAGGMGEVYRARDVRLDRTVAIKILPGLFASDQESRQRFEREARAIAALSHPHICTLYDVGEEVIPGGAGPVQFLVMEHLEGQTLADALRGKRLPLDQVLRIGTQCAAALDRAHRSGIVHRDMKPGNIMLTSRGAVLLDFGLARTLRGPISGMSGDATVPGPVTVEGTILGTPHYMSPEQVEGKKVDARSDIFSLGTILYEMAMGKKAFERDSVARVMSAILQDDPPPLSDRHPPAPPLFDHIVARCLAKDPDERWQSAGDVMRELDWLAQTGDRTTQPANAKSPSRWPERLGWVAGLVAVGAIAMLATRTFVLRREGAWRQEIRPDIATPATSDPFSLAISPDGQKVVFAAPVNGVRQLWLRRLDTESQAPLKGTDHGYLPFWSPDGKAIGFGASGQLKRINLDNESVHKLANAPLFLGGAWGLDGHILYVPNTNSRVYRIVADGKGQPTAVTPILGRGNQSAPHFLPRTGRVLFYVTSPDAPELRGIYVSNADGTGVKRLFEADSPAVYAPSGHLLFRLKESLFARPFDAAKAEPTGEPIKVTDQIMNRAWAGSPIVALSVADKGGIVFRAGATPQDVFQFVWFDRSGSEVKPLTPRLPVVLNPALTRDGGRAAFFKGRNVYLLDVSDGRQDQFTFEDSLDFAAVWSPDASHIIFSSNRKGRHDLYRKHASGAGGDTLLLETGEDKIPTDWSADGRFLLYRNMDASYNFDIRGLSLGDNKQFTVVASEHDERDAQLSPDLKWVAYQSNETGRFEIWVRPFRPPGTEARSDERRRITTDGGIHVRWRRDNSSELFYVGLDGRLMAVPIREIENGRAIKPGTPVALNAPLIPALFGGGAALPSYAVTKDGQRFLMTTVPLPPSDTPITLLLNWAAPR